MLCTVLVSHRGNKSSPELAGRSATDPCSLLSTATTPMLSSDPASDTGFHFSSATGFVQRSTTICCLRMMIASLRACDFNRSDARLSGELPQIVHRVLTYLSLSPADVPYRVFSALLNLSTHLPSCSTVLCNAHIRFIGSSMP